jgi:hypothetical protein
MAATPNTGKTHIKNSRLIVGEIDLSGVSRQVGSVGVEYATNDITGYSNGVHYVQLGHANHLFNGYQAVFSNLGTTGSHTELKDREEYIISYLIGVQAATAAMMFLGAPYWKLAHNGQRRPTLPALIIWSHQQTGL